MTRPVDHLGIQVESAGVVRAELARVKSAGVAVREETARRLLPRHGLTAPRLGID